MLFSEFLRSKDQKILQKLNIQDCFFYILGFSLYGVSQAKTAWRNKYMI